jgi:hypothetical protein
MIDTGFIKKTKRSLEEQLKNTIALALALITTSTFASSHEKVLKQVDVLLAKDSYEAAFKCGQRATKLDQTCWDNECQVSYIDSEVTTCGAVTTIATAGEGDDGEASEMQFNKAIYLQLKGNPLRILEQSSNKFKDMGLEWTSAKALKVSHLGVSRNALEVTGKIEICIEEGEVDPNEGKKTEVCTFGPVKVVIVQGVPFIAKIPLINMSVDRFSVSQNLIEFSRKE